MTSLVEGGERMILNVSLNSKRRSLMMGKGLHSVVLDGLNV